MALTTPAQRQSRARLANLAARIRRLAATLQSTQRELEREQAHFDELKARRPESAGAA
jgi:hypothetical protein